MLPAFRWRIGQPTDINAVTNGEHTNNEHTNTFIHPQNCPKRDNTRFTVQSSTHTRAPPRTRAHNHPDSRKHKSKRQQRTLSTLATAKVSGVSFEKSCSGNEAFMADMRFTINRWPPDSVGATAGTKWIFCRVQPTQRVENTQTSHSASTLSRQRAQHKGKQTE